MPARVLTVEDVARFLPAQGAVHSEPHGWAVVGVPANFWVDVTAATVEGELFDAPAQVRFTPTGYLWDYGDGVVEQTASPGSSWAQLGQQDLTATPTSHLYRQRGPVAVSVRVLYRAEYRVDGGDWIPVQGAVVAVTPPADELVTIESTVLTSGD